MEQLFFPETMITAALVAEAGGITLQLMDANNARVQVGERTCYLSVARALYEVSEALRQLRVELEGADGE